MFGQKQFWKKNFWREKNLEKIWKGKIRKEKFLEVFERYLLEVFRRFYILGVEFSPADRAV